MGDEAEHTGCEAQHGVGFKYQARDSTGNMRVDFMLVGAQKCGTTSLAEQLAAHPSICFCKTKEPGYFHRVDDWEAGLDTYHALYAPADGQICGEASTMYTFLPEWEGTYSRLFAYNPNLKLIYIMRQPVDRVVSNYGHDLVRGEVKSRPEVAVLRNPAYINRSRYGVQIRPYLELFGRDNVLLLVAEEYAADQWETLRRVAEFLGVSVDLFESTQPVIRHKTVGEWYLKYKSVRGFTHSSVFQRIRPYVPASVRKPIRRRLSNRLKERPAFSPALRQTLWRFLEDDVHTIEELLERRLDVWRSGETE